LPLAGPTLGCAVVARRRADHQTNGNGRGDPPREDTLDFVLFRAGNQQAPPPSRKEPGALIRAPNERHIPGKGRSRPPVRQPAIGPFYPGSGLSSTGRNAPARGLHPRGETSNAESRLVHPQSFSSFGRPAFNRGALRPARGLPTKGGEGGEGGPDGCR
jgi:hypothetical protein